MLNITLSNSNPLTRQRVSPTPSLLEKETIEVERPGHWWGDTHTSKNWCVSGVRIRSLVNVDFVFHMCRLSGTKQSTLNTRGHKPPRRRRPTWLSRGLPSDRFARSGTCVQIHEGQVWTLGSSRNEEWCTGKVGVVKRGKRRSQTSSTGDEGRVYRRDRGESARLNWSESRGRRVDTPNGPVG